MYAGSKQTNTELYPVKIFLDQVEIGGYLPTDLEDTMNIQKQNQVRICDQIWFFCQGQTLKITMVKLSIPYENWMEQMLYTHICRFTSTYMRTHIYIYIYIYI